MTIGAASAFRLIGIECGKRGRPVPWSSKWFAPPKRQIFGCASTRRNFREILLPTQQFRRRRYPVRNVPRREDELGRLARRDDRLRAPIGRRKDRTCPRRLVAGAVSFATKPATLGTTRRWCDSHKTGRFEFR